jgi:glycosyltransferase involved in cell wall biosynthesis
MMNDLVSIIIPVYNTPKEYLQTCIKSVIVQTYTTIEILIVDDGSNQETAEFCDEIAQRDKRIEVIHKINGGVSSARNLALKHCKGKYVTFIDSDDWVDLTFIHTLVGLIVKTDAQIASCSLSEVFGEPSALSIPQNKKISTLTRKEFYHAMLHSTDILGYLCNKIFVKDFITKGLDESLHFCEDLVFVSEYARNIAKAVSTDMQLYYYRQREPNEAFFTAYNAKILSLLDAYNKVLDIYVTEDADDVIYIERNIFKQALNIKARYKISNADDKIGLNVINSNISRYKHVMSDSRLSISNRINMLLTWMFPANFLRLKRFLLKKKLS